jgi:quinone-modifying oxidoreductase subunit QmoB
MMKQNSHAPIKNNSSPAEVMIFGGGACAQKIATNLAEAGIDVCLSAVDASRPERDVHNRIQWLVGAELVHCRGFAGSYQLRINDNQETKKKSVPAIVLAESDRRSPNFEPYGLKPDSRVMAISDLEDQLRRSEPAMLFGTQANIVFLAGWQNESTPSVARRMLDACLCLQNQTGINAYFMTGNLKVAADGSEMRVHEAKKTGAVFFKFTNDYPTIGQPGDDGFTIDYRDELTRETFRLTADWIVVDETIGPGHYLKKLIQELEIDEDGLGFAQADNVRRLSNMTNRRGIFVAGGSRGILSESEQLADADQVSLRVLAFLNQLDVEPLPEVTITQGRCARCLTCYRLCPHRAIDIGSHISVVTAACQSCGVCVAGCPGRAIEMEGLHIDARIERLMRPPALKPPHETPRIAVFGCARSAGRARELMRMAGHPLPAGVQFIEVPCGGSVAGRHLLAAFEAGADGVMLCTCHTGNCQAETGNQVARMRARASQTLLAAAGVNAQRLKITSVAANMGLEFAYMVEAFIAEINSLNTSSKERQNG